MHEDEFYTKSDGRISNGGADRIIKQIQLVGLFAVILVVVGIIASTVIRNDDPSAITDEAFHPVTILEYGYPPVILGGDSFTLERSRCSTFDGVLTGTSSLVFNPVSGGEVVIIYPPGTPNSLDPGGNLCEGVICLPDDEGFPESSTCPEVFQGLPVPAIESGFYFAVLNTVIQDPQSDRTQTITHTSETFEIASALPYTG